MTRNVSHLQPTDNSSIGGHAGCHAVRGRRHGPSVRSLKGVNQGRELEPNLNLVGLVGLVVGWNLEEPRVPRPASVWCAGGRGCDSGGSIRSGR